MLTSSSRHLQKKTSKVLFAGYKMPHPLEPRIEVKVQTTSATTPASVTDETVSELLVAVSDIAGSFMVRRARFLPCFCG